MEEEHEVPILRIEPQVDLPFLRIPVPRSLAVTVGGGIVLLMFLLGQGVPAQVVLNWLLPAFLLAAWGYHAFRPEKLSLLRWIGVLWEFVNLPHHLVWEPVGAEQRHGRRR